MFRENCRIRSTEVKFFKNNCEYFCILMPVLKDIEKEFLAEFLKIFIWDLFVTLSLLKQKKIFLLLLLDPRILLLHKNHPYWLNFLLDNQRMSEVVVISQLLLDLLFEYLTIIFLSFKLILMVIFRILKTSEVIFSL